MKKLILILLSIFIITPNVLAEELITNTYPVTLVKCDTVENIVVKKDNKTIRISMIAYDKEDGTLNKEINNYVCEKLNNSTNIVIEYDESISGVDKYNREQVWLYVDDALLQKELIEKGYGQVNYVTADYKYLNDLCSVQKSALSNKTGIWNYDGIKEEYCNSGIEIGKKEESTKEEKEKNSSKLYETLHEVILYNFGILLLTLLLVKRVRYGKK